MSTAETALPQTLLRPQRSAVAGAIALLLAAAVLIYGLALTAACCLNSPAVLFAAWRNDPLPGATALSPAARLMALRVQDGTIVTGLRFDSPVRRRPWLLFFYGNAESMLVEQPRLQWLQRRFGINVVCFDYRGYGFSGGVANPSQLRADALQEFDWVHSQAQGAPIIVYGYSLGSQLAIHVAAQRPAAGAIVEAAPASADLMADWLQRWPLIEAVQWLTASVMPLRPDPSVVEFLSAAREVRSLHIPLAVIHGTEDRVVPIAQGETIFAAATTPLKRFVALPGAGHMQIDYSRPPVVGTIDWVIRESSGV
jgi:hypothetical protein